MWYIILGLLIAIYVSINLVLPGTVDGVIEAYIIRPILWITLAVVTYFIAKQEGLNIWNFKKIRRWQIGQSPFHAGLLIGGFQVSLLILAGLLAGFGNSPNVITLESFFIFLVYILSALLGIELCRAYFIKKGTGVRRNITFSIALTAIFFMFIQIRLVEVATLNVAEPMLVVKFIGETIIPLLAMSLFASYLAYYGGALPAIGYLVILRAFETYSPILPDLDWLVTALIGVIAPTIGFLLIQQSIQETNRHLKLTRKLKKKRDPTLTWVAVALACLIFIFFSFGYFGVQPTVINSGSMRPALDTGDIVVLAEVPLDEINEGDIIQYEMNNFSTVHRVYEIRGMTEENPLMFITKGDANDQPDAEPINPEQITGKAVFTIPKLGWIPLVIKELINKIGFTI